MASSIFSAFICIKGHSGLFFRQGDPVPTKAPATLTVPDAEKADEVNEEEEAAPKEEEEA